MNKYRNYDNECLDFRDLVATEVGFRDLNITKALAAVKRIQECFPPQHGVWLKCYEILERIRMNRNTLTKVALHELLCPLLDSPGVENTAESIRHTYSKTHKKELDLPV